MYWDSRDRPSRALRLRYAAMQAAAQFVGRRRADRIWGHWRLEVLDEFIQEARAGGPRAPGSIERRRDLSLEDFRRDYQARGIPVVLEGAASSWPCLSNWTLERLKETCGDDLLPIDHDFGRLGALLEDIENGSPRYLRFYSLLQRHPEFLKDVDLRFPSDRKNPGLSLDQGFQTFIGNTKAAPTPLHSANDGNLFVQIAGKKEWCFYSNHHSFAIDPPPVRSEYRAQRHDQPQFDPFAPDYDAFPAFRYVPSYRTILEPGDVLWNPPYVWHAVKNLTDPTIAFGYRWVNPGQCFALDPLYATLDCLATEPPIWKSMQLADRDFSLVFLEQFPSLRAHPRHSEYLEQIRDSYDSYRAEVDRLRG